MLHDKNKGYLKNDELTIIVEVRSFCDGNYGINNEPFTLNNSEAIIAEFQNVIRKTEHRLKFLAEKEKEFEKRNELMKELEGTMETMAEKVAFKVILDVGIIL